MIPGQRHDLLIGGNGDDTIEGNDGTTSSFQPNLSPFWEPTSAAVTTRERGAASMSSSQHGIDTNGNGNMMMFGHRTAMTSWTLGAVPFVINNVSIRLGNVMFGGDGNDTTTAGDDLTMFGGNDGDAMSGSDGTHLLVLAVNDSYWRVRERHDPRQSRRHRLFSAAGNDDAGRATTAALSRRRSISSLAAGATTRPRRHGPMRSRRRRQ
jgi:hypothetical protein